MTHTGTTYRGTRYNLVPLDAALLELHGPVLVAMDQETLGQRWGLQEFRLELPGKWDCSRLALTGEGAAAGYAIASLKPEGIHLHRLVVGRPHRKQGLGARLLRSIASARPEAGRVTLKVHPENEAAIRLYSNLGFVETTRGPSNVHMAIPVASLLEDARSPVR